MSGIIAQNVGRPSGLIKAAAATGGGTWVEIKSLTASADGTLDFVNGSSDVVLDSTYPVYCFEYINLHPATNAQDMMFNGSSDTGSNYNVTKTTTYWHSRHNEADDATQLTYLSGLDVAQGTGFQPMAKAVGNGNDESCSGKLFLFALSDTTFVKHFLGRTVALQGDDEAQDNYYGGYFNTTSAVDAIQFKYESGNIDSGKIKLFGIKDS